MKPSVRRSSIHTKKRNKTHPRNNRARPNRTPPLHRHARQNRHIRPNKAILLNHNRLPQIRSLAAQPLLRIDRHRRGEDTHIRSNHAAVPDLDRRAVEDRAVAIDTHVLPDRDVIPVIARKRRRDDAALAHVPLRIHRRGQVRRHAGQLLGLQDVAEEAGAVLGEVAVVGVGAVVEAPRGGVAALALEDELAVEGEEVVARQHLLLLRAARVGGWVGEGEARGVLGGCGLRRVRVRAVRVGGVEDAEVRDRVCRLRSPSVMLAAALVQQGRHALVIHLRKTIGVIALADSAYRCRKGVGLRVRDG